MRPDPDSLALFEALVAEHADQPGPVVARGARKVALLAIALPFSAARMSLGIVGRASREVWRFGAVDLSSDAPQR